MWCLLSKLGETGTSFNLLLHLIPKSDGLYYPGVTSESLYCSSCGYCLKNRAFLNCVNILMIYHVLHSLILRTRRGTIVLHLMCGLGPKVRTQVTTTYIRLTFKVPRKAHLPFLNLPYPAAGVSSWVRVWALSSTETVGLYLGATLCQNRCMHVHVCDRLPVSAYYFVGVSSNFRIIPSEQDSNTTRGTEIKWENTWCRGLHQRRRLCPTPVLLPGKSHGQRSLVGCSPWGREESGTTERLHFHLLLSCIGEGNGNPLQCSFLAEPGGLPSMGSHRVRHNWSNLAAAAILTSHSLWGFFLVEKGRIKVVAGTMHRWCNPLCPAR